MLGQTRPTAIDRTLPLTILPVELETSAPIRVNLADKSVVRSTMTATVSDSRSPEAASRGQEVDSFEQAGLTHTIGTQHEMAAGSKRLSKGCQIAKSSGFKTNEHRG